MVSDVTGIEQIVPAQTIGAAYGDAFLAALAIGMVSKPDEIKTWVKPSRVIQPDPTVHDIYARYYREYRRLYPVLKEQMHALARLGEGGGV